MPRILTNEELDRMQDELDKVKYTCKHCGRRAIIPQWETKKLCKWCGNYVFKNDKDEFNYRMKERLK